MIAIRQHVARQALQEIALGALIVAAILFAYAEPLIGMVDLWFVSPMYSYAFMVPIVSAGLVWARREALVALRPQPARLVGTSVLFLGVAVLVVAGAAGIQVLQQLAFLIALAGAVLSLLGGAYLRVVWAAVAYLLLMVPIWDGLTEPLHWPFQLQSAAMSVHILRIVGIPAHLEGTYVALPGLTLEVARACSGVNYLVAILALGLPLSYLYLSSVGRRVLLIAAAMTIAALSNGLRVALIGILAYFDVGSALHGPLHVLHGLFVAGIGYVILFVGLRLLGDRSPAAGVGELTRAIPSEPWRLPRRELAALTVGFLALGSLVLVHEPRTVPLSAGLEKLPARMGQWEWDTTAAQASLGEDLWPGADTELRRRYRADGETAVDLYIGYFGMQRQDKEIANFRAADWHQRASRVSVTGSGGHTFDANFVHGADGQPDALFWYEVDAAIETSQYGAKLRTLWNTLWRGRSNGAVVMLAFLPAQVDRDQAHAHLQDLGSQVYRALARSPLRTPQ